jgi:hypothetical protein
MDSNNDNFDSAFTEAIDGAMEIFDEVIEDRADKHHPPTHPPPIYTKTTEPPVDTSTTQTPPKPLEIQKFDLEGGKVPVHANGPMERLRRRTKRIGNGFGKGANSVYLIVLCVVLCALPDGLYVIYAYYFNYAEIFFNSTVAMNIFRNDDTENAFKAFYWILALLCLIPNFFIGYGFAMIGWGIAKGCKMQGCLSCCWMIPWVFAAVMIKTATLWGRPVAEGVWQANVWNDDCPTWDLAVTIASSDVSNLAETLPTVGTANITSATLGYNFTVDLNRHDDNHQRFDLHVTSMSGTIEPPFSIITFDSQNRTYNGTATGNANITGSYDATPNLAFPSRNLTQLDPSIPWQRPDYSTCWPPAVNLIKHISTTEYLNVIKSITLNPDDGTQLKVCGMAGVVAVDFQIALGVVFIEQYKYALCSTTPEATSSIGDNTDPEAWGDD